MKRKGFTLIELLAVIVVIAIVATISVIAVTNISSSQKTKAYNKQVTMILAKASDWTIKNVDTLAPEGGINFVDLSTLVSEGYVDNTTINDPRDGSTMTGCITIIYNTSTSQYDYDYTDGTCDNARQKYGPIFTYNDANNNSSSIEVFNTFTEPKVKAVSSSSSAQVLTVKRDSIKKVNTDNTLGSESYDTVSTNVVGEKYRITYSAYDAAYKYTFTGTYDVEIVDTQNPSMSINYPTTTSNYLTNGIYVDNVLYIIQNSSFVLPTVTVKDNSCGLNKVTLGYNHCDVVVNYADKSSNSINTASETSGTVTYTTHDYTKKTGSFAVNHTVTAALNYRVVASTYFNPTFNIASGWAQYKNVTVNYKSLGNGNVNYQYSTDNNNWSNYSSAVRYNNNGTIYSRVLIDGTQFAYSSATVSQIDTTYPTFNVTSSSGGSYVTSLTLTIANASDSESGLAAAPYSFDGGATWTATNTKTYTSGASVNIQVKDNVGRVTAKTVTVNAVTQYQVNYYSTYVTGSYTCGCSTSCGNCHGNTGNCAQNQGVPVCDCSENSNGTEVRVCNYITTGCSTCYNYGTSYGTTGWQNSTAAPSGQTYNGIAATRVLVQSNGI